MEVKDVISRLNTALTAEVEAILVYINIHTVCECPMLKLLMLEVSMDEMRHVKMLAECIDEIEGEPELKPRKVRLVYGEDDKMLEHVETLEEEARELYTKLIKEMDDEEIIKILTKILNEEYEHHDDIDELKEEWAEEEDEEEDDKEEDEEDDDKKEK